jgi:hypothetical protein
VGRRSCVGREEERGGKRRREYNKVKYSNRNKTKTIIV